MPPLRICLDARLSDGQHGGVQQVVIGLASAFSKLDDGLEEYSFLVTPEAGHWIRPWLAGPCRLLEAPEPRRPRRPARTLRELRAWAGPSFVRLPRSDGTIERAGIDLMHFTVQTAFLTRTPSVYVPHDLQHAHLPHLFERRELAERTAMYRRFCAEARMVVALSSWGKRDIVQTYGLPSDRVQVIPNAPVLDAYPEPTSAELAAARVRLALPDAFLFFPAATWPHKNHLALLDALAALRDREQLMVPLVCSGLQTDHFREIASRTTALGLSAQVRFVGWVSAIDLRCLYMLARAVAFPSLFEGFGLPVVEAFAAGVPVACSNVASLPALAGDAALLFDPLDVDQMAAAIARVWIDEDLRSSLVERGRARVAAFTWDRSARLLRAHYRRLAGRALGDEDRAFVDAPPVL